MERREKIFLGFYFQEARTIVNSKRLISVASFLPGTKFRLVISLNVDPKHEFKRGQMIHFTTKDDMLRSHAHVELKQMDNYGFLQQSKKNQDIVYKMTNVVVTPDQLTLQSTEELGYYMHPILGKIIDENSFIKPGRYKYIELHVYLPNVPCRRTQIYVNVIGCLPVPLSLSTALDISYPKSFKEVVALLMVDSESMDYKTESQLINQWTSKFDENQSMALKISLSEEKPITCIQGQAGSGKSHVLAVLLATLLHRHKKVMVIGPTEYGLENLEKMLMRNLETAGTLIEENSILNCSKFPNVVDASIRSSAANTISLIERVGTEGSFSRTIIDEMKKTFWNSIFRHTKREIFAAVKILFCTVESPIIKTAIKNGFDPCFVVIDSVNQVLKDQWPMGLVPRNIVVAGDLKQIRPMIWNKGIGSMMFRKSVLDIIQKQDKHSRYTVKLCEQYRCHHMIMKWSDNNIYNSNSDKKMNLTLRFLFPLPPSHCFRKMFDPFVFLDTSMDQRIEFQERNEQMQSGINSYYNIGEAKLAIQHYKHLREYGVQAENIAIFAPYEEQVNVLKKLLGEELVNDKGSIRTKVGNIESAEGQEWEAVIFSMVRSNEKDSLGQVQNLHRLNLVVTRAKRHFVLIGNGRLLKRCQKPEIRNLLETFKEYSRRYYSQNLIDDEVVIEKPKTTFLRNA